VVNAAHHLAAGPVVFGDAEGLAGAGGVEAEGAGAEGGAGDGNPGTGGVVVRGRAVEGDAGAGADLVAEDEGGQELRAVGAILRLGEGEKRGEGAAADVPLGELVAVVSIEGVDGHPAGQRGAGGADRAAVEEHAGGGAAGGKVAGGVVPDDGGKIGAAAAGGDAEEVEEPASGEGADLVGEV
jgi:hypothetical protein